MPGLDGHRVAELLLREQADLRVVFLSGRRSFARTARMRSTSSSGAPPTLSWNLR